MKRQKILLIAAALLVAAASAFTLVPNVVEAHTRTVKIDVGRNGFSPSSIEAETGHKLNLIFRRTDKNSCGSVVVFPGRNIRRSLPVGKNVVVSVTPTQTGQINFTCGMGMYRGSIVVTEG